VEVSATTSALPLVSEHTSHFFYCSVIKGDSMKLRKRRNQYVARIRTWNGYKEKEIAIPLRTDKKDIALINMTEIKALEQDIKKGVILPIQFKEYFKWLNDDRTSKLVLLSVEVAKNQFVEAHSVNIAESSMKRIIVSLNNALRIWGKSTAIRDINIEHIENFKKAFKGKHSPFGINLNLRNIKTFLNWCCDRDLIKKVPKIVMMKQPTFNPKYITEKQFRSLMQLDSVNDCYKDSFSLLLSTGMRRSEMICGELIGNMLIVSAEISKSRIERQITLTDNQIGIIAQVHTARDKHMSKGSSLITFKDKFTKVFKDACEKIGIVIRDAEGVIVKGKRINLHCLRHTFAVVQWIVSSDIYEVKNLLGHTSVKTTEKYARFNVERLANDFPSAYQIRLKVEKVRGNVFRDTLIRDTDKEIGDLSKGRLLPMSDC